LSTAEATDVVNQAQRRETTIAAILRVARALLASVVSPRPASIGLRPNPLAKGAVYHHFASKEALFTAVLEAVQADVAKSPLPASVARLTDPLDQIAAGVRTTWSQPTSRYAAHSADRRPYRDRLAEVARNRRPHIRRRCESGHYVRAWAQR
jgi:hypothetical protein